MARANASNTMGVYFANAGHEFGEFRDGPMATNDEYARAVHTRCDAIAARPLPKCPRDCARRSTRWNFVFFACHLKKLWRALAALNGGASFLERANSLGRERK